MEDTLDSILGGSDDEAEEDAVISQVLDEIGIEVSGKVRVLLVSLFIITSWLFEQTNEIAQNRLIIYQPRTNKSFINFFMVPPFKYTLDDIGAANLFWPEILASTTKILVCVLSLWAIKS